MGDGKKVKEHIEKMSQPSLETLQKQLTTTIDGVPHEIPKEILQLGRKKEKISVNSFTPSVIGPSFGIDRIFSAILDHVYYARPAEEGEKQTRGVLAFAANIAPYKCTMLPLDQRIVRDEKFVNIKQDVCSRLSQLGLSTTTDESGATLGRRYARNDELGIPFAVTYDFTTLQDKTVTVRERDTMRQIRLPVNDVPGLLSDLCEGRSTWDDALSKYPNV